MSYSSLYFQKPIVVKEEKIVSVEKANAANEAYEFLNCFLEQNEWLAGDHITIADFNTFATVSALEVLVPIDKNKHQNLNRWCEKMSSSPWIKAGEEGLIAFRKLMESRMNS